MCKPAGQLCGGFAVSAAVHHLPCGSVPCLCHRHFLGHLLHPDPHRLSGLPGRRDAGGVHCRLPVRRGVRRPLLPHLGYHHHGLGGRALQPCEPRFHPAALRHYGGSLLGGVLRHHRPCTGSAGQPRKPCHLAGAAGGCHRAGTGGAQRHPRPHPGKKLPGMLCKNSAMQRGIFVVY